MKSPINKNTTSNIKIVHINKRDLPVSMHTDLLTNKHRNIKLIKNKNY